ncbi:hypothetical protein AAFC00_002832 [Neodothiora populina]|uniref:Beta-lactamase-related domain-containing protein n=1 Tax=Neodothiora populina TaxID=2781224 RepID=A0ABR3P9N6_9PEZI
MAAMKLVSQERLSLFEAITSYLPPSLLTCITTPETAALLKHVTVKHLLSHTSGLTVHGLPGYDGPGLPDVDTILSGQAPTNTLQIRLAGFPGCRFAYSGGGYMILQMILELITSKCFADLMHELVFEPLQRTRSSYRTPGRGDNYASSYYTGYTKMESRFHIYPEQAAAGLWTTPSDLLKVVKALQDSVAPSSDTIAFWPRDMAKEMLTGISDGYGIGWNVSYKGDSAAGVPSAIQHSGDNHGFKCHLFGFLPESFEAKSDCGAKKKDTTLESSGVCVMTNSGQGYDVVCKIMHALAYIKGWPTLANEAQKNMVIVPFSCSQSEEIPYVKYEETWQDWTGRWAQEWSLVNVRGVPQMQFQNLPAVQLLPAAISATLQEGRPCFNFVAEGLDVMVKLGWRHDLRVIDVWHGGRGDITALERPS